MAPIIKKNKRKSLKAPAAGKKETKFLSQAIANKRKSMINKKKKRPKTKGLVFIKNLPHGFYEEQLRGYFSQFGAVTRLRLGRSPSTLNSRGYAFVEFRYPEVAQIAAEAMNNYIMFHRVIKTKFIAPTDIRHDYFRSNIFTVQKDGEKVLTSRKLLAAQAMVEQTNRLMTDADQKKLIQAAAKKHRQKKRKLEELGIDFDLDSVAKNLSEEVIKAPTKSEKALTIENLNPADLDDDDDADETFDPTKFDIESGDEFEDYEYDSEGSVSDEPIAKEKAVKAAKEAKAKKIAESKAKTKESVVKVVKELKQKQESVVAVRTSKRAAANKQAKAAEVKPIVVQKKSVAKSESKAPKKSAEKPTAEKKPITKKPQAKAAKKSSEDKPAAVKPAKAVKAAVKTAPAKSDVTAKKQPAKKKSKKA